MSDVKISGLPAASQANDADLLEKVDSLSGLNQKITVAQIAAHLGPSLWSRQTTPDRISVVGGVFTAGDNGDIKSTDDFHFDPDVSALQLGVSSWAHLYNFPATGEFILSYNFTSDGSVIT